MANNLSSSKALLYALFQIVGGIAKTVAISYDIAHWHKTYMDGGLTYVRELKQLRYKRKLEGAFYNLKRSQYIKTKKIGDKLFLQLTSKGRQLLLKNKIKKAPVLKNDLYVLIIFDVPESQRHARDQLRLFLKDTDFKQLQKSVWVSKQNVYDELSLFIKQLEVENWVNIALVKNLLKTPDK